MKKIILTAIAALFAAATVSAQDVNQAIENLNNGVMSQQMGDNASALEFFKQALAIAESCGDAGNDVVAQCKTVIPATIFARGKQYIDNDDYDNAIATLNEAMTSAKEYGNTEVQDAVPERLFQAYFLKGNSLIKAKNLAGAIEAINQAIAIDPENGRAYLLLGSAYASSGTYFSGNASLNAAKDLLRKTLEEAALQLEVPVEKLSVEYPGYVVAEDGRKLSYYEISHTATSGTGRGQLVGTGSFTTPNFAVPYGAHFAEVAVNVRTGEIKVRKFYALQDAGTPINPELALCQMYGAVLKSIGHTLYEDMVLDKDGKCLTTTFTDYGVPMIQDAPDDMKAVLIDVNDDYGPFGAKSISEIACNGAAPAIAMAIADATGVWVRSWPITGEKILKALGKF